MAVFRVLILLLLALMVGLFVAFAATGQPRYKRLGLLVLKWTILAALGFFAGMAIERLLAAPA
ncbi:MAG: hypothetical protein QM617_10835 [Comamonas sp.]